MITRTIGQATIHNVDCMEFLKGCDDNQFDLAIVDPPYGINAGSELSRSLRRNKNIEKKSWDTGVPSIDYFDELIRVSANQIIWGGNYFIDYLKSTKCFLYWHKPNTAGRNFADGEMAWTSFDRAAKSYTCSSVDTYRIHPTQKPVALYEWILHKYAKPGDTILDTHMGSGSIAVACNRHGFDLTACEMDADYYEAACKRIEQENAQLEMFAHE